MKFIVFTLAILSIVGCQMDEILSEDQLTCDGYTEGNFPYSVEGSFIDLMEGMVSSGIPGIQLSVYQSDFGYWDGAAGYADLASRVSMEPCQITRVGSTVKTFTAVSILLLQEEGLLDINDTVLKYLDEGLLEDIENADKATIEQLLKHSSGIYNYIQSAKFQTASLNDLTKVWQPNELLDYARGQGSYFRPGEDVLYSNTNYILLGMIIEEVTGEPFYRFFEERIFHPLRLKHTQFAAEDPVPENIVRGYVDFYSNFNLINATNYSGWDYFTADGGLISTAHDLNVFLTSLFNGELLSDKSMTQMLNWQMPKDQDKDGFETSFGLGIFRLETEYGPAYMHSGDAIGYFASMVHFPSQNVTISWAVNGNYGKLNDISQSKETMEKIFEMVIDLK